MLTQGIVNYTLYTSTVEEEKINNCIIIKRKYDTLELGLNDLK